MLANQATKNSVTCPTEIKVQIVTKQNIILILLLCTQCTLKKLKLIIYDTSCSTCYMITLCNNFIAFTFVLECYFKWFLLQRDFSNIKEVLRALEKYLNTIYSILNPFFRLRPNLIISSRKL